MRKICAKVVPKLLTIDQKARRIDVSHDILERLETKSNLLQNVITGEESWVFEYDLETKRQSLQWKMSTFPKAKKARSKIKVMLIAFFDARGFVHFQFLPQG